MDLPTSFGAWVKERRRQLDLTQVDLASNVGCTAATIRKIEADERRPSRQLAELLANCLQIPAEQQPLFLQIARGERQVRQLSKVSAVLTEELSLDHLLPRPKTSLPLPPTPLLGRQQELLSIAQLIENPNCRLLTLIGPGGIGKTRLGLHIAHQYQAAFTHGAAFVPLASIVNGEQMVTAVADALGFVLYGATDRGGQLLHYLQGKALLLVLDNLEHLLTDEFTPSFINDLLTHAPEVKLLVTSREPLNLQTEWIFKVSGLPLPEGGQEDELATNSAVQLFLQRAQRARAGFALTEANSPMVLRICQLVDGLPLGIELAAAWVLTLSCQEIAQELERDLDFLVTSTRDIAERHRSLGAVFDHSWQLLSAEEQRVLRKLAVFRGGFAREAAEYVTGASLSLLSALVAKSLLRRTDAKAGRYDLHELVRQYVLGQLMQDEQEYTQTQQRHCHYYMALLARRGLALKGTERAAVVAELITEIANLRLAWNWAAAHYQVEQLSQAADTLFWLYESRSNCREGVPLFNQAVQSLRGNNETAASMTRKEQLQRLALSQTLNYQGFFLFRQGQHSQGRDLLQYSLSLLKTMMNQDDLAVRTTLSDTTAFLGTVTSVMGDYAEGHQLLHEGLLTKRALGDRWGSAFCLRQLGLSANYLGEYGKARQFLNDSLTLSREMGNTWAIASTLNILGLATLAQGDYSEAQRVLEEGLAQSQAIEDRYNIAMSLNGLGLVSDALNNKTEARHFFQESIALWHEIGDYGGLAQTLNNLGKTIMGEGKLREAKELFSEALSIAQEAGMMPVLLEALVGLTTLKVQTEATEGTLKLLTFVLQHPASSRETKSQAAQLQNELSSELATETQFQFEGWTVEEFVVDLLGNESAV